MTFGNTLREVRMSKGTTIAELAKRLDVSPTFISSLEHDKKKAPKNFLSKLMTAISLSYEEYYKLAQCIQQTDQELLISLEQMSEIQIKVILKFSAHLEELSENDLNDLLRIIDRSSS